VIETNTEVGRSRFNLQHRITQERRDRGRRASVAVWIVRDKARPGRFSSTIRTEIVAEPEML